MIAMSTVPDEHPARALDRRDWYDFPGYLRVSAIVAQICVTKKQIRIIQLLALIQN
jgi:hypothetical protein